MKWPFMTTRKAYRLADEEFTRGSGLKKGVLHDWARTATYNAYTNRNINQAIAAFQELDAMFGPVYNYDALTKDNVRAIARAADGKLEVFDGSSRTR